MAIEKKVKKGYKTTESGVIPVDWDIQPFKQVSFMKGRIGWQGLKQTEFTMDANEPYLITGMNFKDGDIRWDEVYHVSESRYKIAKEIQLKDDDVLMTKDGTIGKLLYITHIPYPGKATLNSHLLVFRPIRNSYVPKFLYYQLSSRAFAEFIELHKSGTTFFGLSQGAVGKYSVVLPDVNEQAAIARALSDIDILIEQLEKMVFKKKAIKHGAMQQLLTGKKRLESFNGKWSKKKLVELLKVRHGKSQKSVEKPDGKFPILGTGGEIGRTDTFLYSKPSVLIGRKGTIDKPVYIDTPFWTVDTLFYTEIFANADAKYIFYKFCSIDWYSYNEASGVPSLNASTIEAIEISIPPTIDEQRAVASVLSDMDNEIEAIENRLRKTLGLKQGMMQKLLTGSIRLV